MGNHRDRDGPGTRHTTVDNVTAQGKGTSKHTTGDNGVQKNTGHYRRPQRTTGITGEHTHVKRMISDKTVFSQ